MRIAELYKRAHTNFDATLSAYGYYGKRDPDVFTYFVEEKKFLTPYMRSVIDARAPRPVNQQFENIYWTKRKEIKAFYDAGGGDLITLGTDHPSWGEFFTPATSRRQGCRVYDPAALMTSVEGKIGPMSAADTAAWAPTPRQRRGGNGATNPPGR